ncbi:MAG: Rrf2 family transcriptional regulator [Clostridia bacterium]|nr:Rrf2 family transcriptional regulator [Clostridia bacterium]
MMISSKGKYALQIVLDLAQQAAVCPCGGEDAEGNCVSLKAISERQNISMKYLESIAALLNRGGLIRSTRGKDGGYRLAKPAEEITVAEIMAITEGSLAPVACLETCAEGQCVHADGCLTLPMWQQLDQIIDAYLSGVTIRDILDRRV